jgi:hypothetical protein
MNNNNNNNINNKQQEQQQEEEQSRGPREVQEKQDGLNRRDKGTT